jgi:hypothetical protein
MLSDKKIVIRGGATIINTDTMERVILARAIYVYYHYYDRLLKVYLFHWRGAEYSVSAEDTVAV